jgi:alpha-1,2-mannosyltransferase
MRMHLSATQPTSTGRFRDVDVLVRVGNIFLAGLLLRQLTVVFRVIPAGLYDFKIFRSAGLAVLHGQSPFGVDGYIYPATAAVAFVPFAALSFTLGAWIFALLTVLALMAALWILDVRDWRCYAVVFVSMPGWTSVTTGTLSGVCALLAAAVYRYRDDRPRSALALAIGATSKVFLWPLGVWLAATRRTRTVGVALALALFFVALSWLVIGTANFAAYHDSLRQARELAQASYSPFALLRAVGLAPGLSTLAIALVGLSLLGTAWFVKNEALTFSLAVFAALLMSPVIWIHYLVLIYVPIAIARPRLSPLWFMPVLFAPIGLRAHADGSVLRISLVLALMTMTFLLIARACRPNRDARSHRSALPDVAAPAHSFEPQRKPVTQS